jgi:hypothetical protein
MANDMGAEMPISSVGLELSLQPNISFRAPQALWVHRG